MDLMVSTPVVCVGTVLDALRALCTRSARRGHATRHLKLNFKCTHPSRHIAPKFLSLFPNTPALSRPDESWSRFNGVLQHALHALTNC